MGVLFFINCTTVLLFCFDKLPSPVLILTILLCATKKTAVAIELVVGINKKLTDLKSWRPNEKGERGNMHVRKK